MGKESSRKKISSSKCELRNRDWTPGCAFCLCQNFPLWDRIDRIDIMYTVLLELSSSSNAPKFIFMPPDAIMPSSFSAIRQSICSTFHTTALTRPVASSVRIVTPFLFFKTFSIKASPAL